MNQHEKSYLVFGVVVGSVTSFCFASVVLKNPTFNEVQKRKLKKSFYSRKQTCSKIVELME